MLVDDITLKIKAGDGGNGAVSFLRNGLTAKGGPDGGNGGNGGDIYFQGSHNITDLREFRFKKKISAQNGINGGKRNLYGKNAPAITIFVPIGTHITDTETDKTVEILNDTSSVLLARGGMGGRGNNAFKSALHQTPTERELGTKGEEKTLRVTLRLIAEVGLIGLPNAGKSSLLSVLTNANPKVGNYPFTTVEPNLGMLDGHAIADIPGLIEGASHGKGLGTSFLKHIEKTKMLVHCIDATEQDPLQTYDTVRKEFKQYNTTLLDKPEIILFTKADLVDKASLTTRISLFTKKKKTVVACSIYDEKSIENLKKHLITLLSRVD